MRCVVFAVPFSPNLGDGVIFECLRHRLEQRGIDVSGIDLSGRTGFGSTSAAREVRTRRWLVKVPRALRPLLPIVKFGLVDRGKLKRAYSMQAAGADFALIGGGQMFSDVALNFPVKMTLVAGVIRNRRLPTGIFAVGAPRRMTRGAAMLFRHALRRMPLRYAGARDEDSVASLSQLLPSGPSVQCVFDPALIAYRVYPEAAGQNRTRRIGINVIGDLAINLGGTGIKALAVNRPQAYVEMARILAERGYQPVFMTNGSADDDIFIGTICDTAQSEGFTDYEIAPKSLCPADLVHCIAGFEGMIAHRLHANIIAYSFGIPTIGFSRDAKVPSFFARVGRSPFCLDNSSSAQSVVDALEAALTMGVDGGNVARHADQVCDSIDALVAHCLGSAKERMPFPSSLPNGTLWTI